MDVLERFVAGLSDEDFDLLNRDRAFAQRLLDHHSDLQRASLGDAKAFERLARRAADDRLEEIERPEPRYSTPPIVPRPTPATRMTMAPTIATRPSPGPKPAFNLTGNRMPAATRPRGLTPRQPMSIPPGAGSATRTPNWGAIGAVAAGAGAAIADGPLPFGDALLLGALGVLLSGDSNTSTNARTPADEEDESPDEREERCEQNAERDYEICRELSKQAQAAKRRGDEAVGMAKGRLTALCWASSKQRLADCRAGKQLRPLYTDEPD